MDCFPVTLVLVMNYLLNSCLFYIRVLSDMAIIAYYNLSE